MRSCLFRCYIVTRRKTRNEAEVPFLAFAGEKTVYVRKKTNEAIRFSSKAILIALHSALFEEYNDSFQMKKQQLEKNETKASRTKRR